MLRRRRKTLKAPQAVQSAGATGSRRRPRPGAQVPSELILTERVALKPKPMAPRDGPVVLVSGFDPFCGERVNPSWQICEKLPRAIGGMRVETCRVPCEFRRAIETLVEAIERVKPTFVICLGQASGRAHLSVERVAINVDDARVADNGGVQPVDEPIAANGPPAYFATLPIKAMVEAMHAAGVPAEVSNSAGTYLCNHLMYGVLHHFAASGREARAGFIHVPYSEEQVIDKPAIPAMALMTMVKGVEAGIAAAVKRSEAREEGGHGESTEEQLK